MLSSIVSYVLLFSFWGFVWSDNCPRVHLHVLYHELGCTPVFENNSLCPTKYDCPKGKESKKCYYKGVSYSDGNEIPKSILGNSCVASCKCLSFGEATADFHCANIECPEFFGPPLNSTCYFQYNLNDCCPSISCDKSTVCTYKGKNYALGEKFEDGDLPCQDCYCLNEGVTCRDILCNSEIHSSRNLRDGCSPIYYKNDGCCPIEWRCPDKKYKVQATLEKSPQQTQGKCRFGNLELRQGDTIQSEDNENADCKCLVPPYLSCTLKAN